MKAMYNLIQIERQYKNNGQHLEQVARYNLTGKIEKADNKPFWLDSDCLDIQIKSARATVCNSLDIEEHLQRDKAQRYGYITKDGQTLYIMNKIEYKQFLNEFKTIDHDSKTKQAKIRLKHESKALLQWLVERV